jgi:hypothetical protein
VQNAWGGETFVCLQVADGHVIQHAYQQYSTTAVPNDENVQQDSSTKQSKRTCSLSSRTASSPMCRCSATRWR